VIELHKDSLKSSKNDTSNLFESFQQTEKAETKLKHSFFSMDDDMDFVKEILSEEHKFQIENQVTFYVNSWIPEEYTRRYFRLIKPI